MKVKYDCWNRTKGQVMNENELEDKIEFLRSQDISDKLIKNIIKESKKVRSKVISELNWTDWPAKTKSDDERDAFRKNYEFLNSFDESKVKKIKDKKVTKRNISKPKLRSSKLIDNDQLDIDEKL